MRSYFEIDNDGTIHIRGVSSSTHSINLIRITHHTHIDRVQIHSSFSVDELLTLIQQCRATRPPFHIQSDF